MLESSNNASTCTNSVRKSRASWGELKPKIKTRLKLELTQSLTWQRALPSWSMKWTAAFEAWPSAKTKNTLPLACKEERSGCSKQIIFLNEFALNRLRIIQIKFGTWSSYLRIYLMEPMHMLNYSWVHRLMELWLWRAWLRCNFFTPFVSDASLTHTS